MSHSHCPTHQGPSLTSHAHNKPHLSSLVPVLIWEQRQPGPQPGSILLSALSSPHPQCFCPTLSAGLAPSREGSALYREAPPLPGKAPPHPRVSSASPPRPEKTPRHSRLGSAAEEGRSAGPAPSAQAPPLPRAGSAQPGCPDSGGCGGTRGVMAASERRAFAHKINR